MTDVSGNEMVGTVECAAADLVQRQAKVPEGLAGKRLDQAVQSLWPEFSRGRLQKWIREGVLTVDDAVVAPKAKVRAGQSLALKVALKPEQDWSAQDIPLDICYEDDHLLVVNKSAGLVVHPAPGHADQTLVNALVFHAPELSHLPRAGIVHRIDKDTTGLLVVAKTLPAHSKLISAMQERLIKREYQALVWGEVAGSATIDKPIGRHPQHRTKMAAIGAGKPAVTHYQIAERFRQHTLLSVQLETGRTHQIRVHLAHVGLPIVGDPVYGGRQRVPGGGQQELISAFEQFTRQALHAERLSLAHPITEEPLSFHASLPEDFHHLMSILRASEAS
jgi:23S rRNA pseudouridine1911/1915/1917 synthase